MDRRYSWFFAMYAQLTAVGRQGHRIPRGNLLSSGQRDRETNNRRQWSPTAPA